MLLYIQDDLKPYFSPDQPLFDQMMALEGERFRHLEGRSTERIQLGGKSYFIKQHTGVGWSEIIKNLSQFRLPVLSAKNEWLAIEKLQAIQIAAPKVVAYGIKGINPAKQKSFVLMEELTPSVSLETLTKDWRTLKPSVTFKRQLIEEVARIARTLHQHGINHRDFYICHFLLDTSLYENDEKRIKLYLIDLHRAQIRHKTPLRWIIKDLSGLYFSSKDIGLTQRDLFRFMKRYHGKSLREIMNLEKSFWQKVKARGEQLYRDHTKK